jgi:hypothetical protein
MNPQNDDRDLREIFAAMRRDEQARLSAFRNLLAPAPRGRTRKNRMAFGLAALATFVIVTWAVISRMPLVADSAKSPGPELALSPSTWTSPTAFLLRTPGHEVLSTVPAFAGAVPDLSAGAHRLAPPTPKTIRERNPSS